VRGLAIVPDLPADGYGVTQVDTGWIPSPLRPTLAHLSGQSPAGLRALNDWWDNRLDAAGLR
jgi:hypothetical protein